MYVQGIQSIKKGVSERRLYNKTNYTLQIITERLQTNKILVCE